MDGITYDFLAEHETDAAFALEKEGFHPEEAATLEKLRYRQANAGDLFLGAYAWRPPAARQLVAYVCSTVAKGEKLTHDSMDAHEVDGETVCIHSVCVAPSMQRRGLAEALVREYVKRLREQSGGRYKRVSLIAHAPLIGLYQRAGFELVSPSDVQHGPDPWYELSASLGESMTRNPGTPFSAFRNRPAVLYEPSMGDKEEKALVNAVPFYCPRRECRSLILLKGCARWEQRSLDPLNDPKAAPTPAPPDFPPESTTGQVGSWSVVPPSPMTFENVSVSKAVPGQPGMKYLGCADCDCGPLGWLSGSEIVLDAARLRYKV